MLRQPPAKRAWRIQLHGADARLHPLRCGAEPNAQQIAERMRGIRGYDQPAAACRPLRRRICECVFDGAGGFADAAFAGEEDKLGAEGWGLRTGA